VFSHKLEALIKFILNQKELTQLKGLCGEITAYSPPLSQSSIAFQKSFNRFIDAENCVSIKAGDGTLIGALSPKDVTILSLFAFATVRRSKSDNVLQIIVCGMNSTGDNCCCCCCNDVVVVVMLFLICFSFFLFAGKSTLWENPLLEVSG
jgi:hypothetical protein